MIAKKQRFVLFEERLKLKRVIYNSLPTTYIIKNMYRFMDSKSFLWKVHLD